MRSFKNRSCHCRRPSKMFLFVEGFKMAFSHYKTSESLSFNRKNYKNSSDCGKSSKMTFKLVCLRMSQDKICQKMIFKRSSKTRFVGRRLSKGLWVVHTSLFKRPLKFPLFILSLSHLLMETIKMTFFNTEDYKIHSLKREALNFRLRKASV